MRLSGLGAESSAMPQSLGIYMRALLSLFFLSFLTIFSIYSKSTDTAFYHSTATALVTLVLTIDFIPLLVIIVLSI